MFYTQMKPFYWIMLGSKSTIRFIFFLMLSSVCLLSCSSAPTNFPEKIKSGLIPKPQQVEVLDGVFHFDENWSISASSDLKDIEEDLQQFLDAYCNITLHSEDDSKTIQLLIDKNLDFGLEGYELDISAPQIQIKANDKAGIQRGLASFKQLILLNEFENNYFLPHIKISDHAVFQHRGLLLDCSRHFFEINVVKKYIDLLALFKMNTLHWHITEDQGWRLAIEKYPKLTAIGGFRIGKDGSKYGGFYTKEDIQEIVAYASSKQINIIPEIELPGHAQAAIASYPYLSCTGQSIEVANDWGVFKEIYCAGNDSVFVFLEDVLTEVMDLFPSKQIHIGGDEAPKVRWEQCNKCQKRIKEEGLTDTHELQSYFIKRIQTFLNKNGRELIGWDEILEGGLAEGAIVQSWRGMEGGVEAVKHGNRAIMSPTSHAYLDYGLDAIDLDKIYSFNPIPNSLTQEESKLIIGGECNMWTEHVSNEKVLDSKVFPRMLAMAEVLWSDSLDRSFVEFNERMEEIYPLLEKFDVQYGEESVAMNHKMILKDNRAKIELMTYSKNISLEQYFDCNNCDTTKTTYVKPLDIFKSGTLKVQPYKKEKEYGDLIEIPFAHHSGINANVTYDADFSKWYTAGGDKGLVDSKLGTLNFRDGAWQGFWGDNLECVLKLNQGIQAVKSISANFYQYNNSWIFIPPKMMVEISDDGKKWQSVGHALSNSDPKQRGKFIETFEIQFDKPLETGFIRIKVENFGKVPEWHEAAGSDAWIFIDEIIIR